MGKISINWENIASSMLNNNIGLHYRPWRQSADGTSWFLGDLGNRNYRDYHLSHEQGQQFHRVCEKAKQDSKIRLLRHSNCGFGYFEEGEDTSVEIWGLAR